MIEDLISAANAGTVKEDLLNYQIDSCANLDQRIELIRSLKDKTNISERLDEIVDSLYFLELLKDKDCFSDLARIFNYTALLREFFSLYRVFLTLESKTGELNFDLKEAIKIYSRVERVEYFLLSCHSVMWSLSGYDGGGSQWFVLDLDDSKMLSSEYHEITGYITVFLAVLEQDVKSKVKNWLSNQDISKTPLFLVLYLVKAFSSSEDDSKNMLEELESLPWEWFVVANRSEGLSDFEIEFLRLT